MGNEPTNNKRGPTKPIDKSKLDIIVKQIYFTAQLNRDRRRGQQLAREKELLNLIREPSNKRNRDNEYQKAASLVNDVKWVKALETIMRYCDIIKDNEMVIQLSKGDATKINDLLPYVESIIYGCRKCNLVCVEDFNKFIVQCFGLDVFEALSMGSKVTPDIKACFDSILASEREVKLYFVDFCKQHGLELETLNEIGHKINIDELNAPPPQQNGQPGNFGGQGPYPGQGGFPNQGGYPQGPQGGFPQQGGYGGYPQGPQGGYPQGPQGGYPQQGGYGGYPQGPQGGYPQGGFQQGGYPQGPQGGYPNQGGYPQGPQGGFPQQGGYGGGYPQQQQGGFNQGGYPQNNYQSQPQPQNNMYPDFSAYGGHQGGYQQPGPQITVKITETIPSNPVQPDPRYVPSQQSQPSQPNPQQFSHQSSGHVAQPQSQPSNTFDNGSYPTFQKFTDANAGPKMSGDPLDELDLRLKNIKNGL